MTLADYQAMGLEELRLNRTVINAIACVKIRFETSGFCNVIGSNH